MVKEGEPQLSSMIESALGVLNRHLSRRPESVIGVVGSNDGWVLVVEALERKGVPDTQDILGRYEVKLDTHGKVLGWKQTMVRRRSDHYIEERES
jgi:hypothetical protein